MADKRKDPDRADEGPIEEVAETPKQAMSRRIKGARFFGGRWEAADGTPLTDAEAQQAHRAMDRAAALAREKALRGEV